MKAILLAAGYATRLKPLTDAIAKPLLPVGGRPMVEYILDKIGEIGEVNEVHLVTNHKFASSFETWTKSYKGKHPVVVHDDGTTSNEDRLGAIGDIRFTIERGKLQGDDLIVIAGDNLFDYSLEDYVRYWRGKKDGSGLALYECADLELVKQYSIVELDAADRIVSFIEKPKNPTTRLVGTATYIYHRDHVPLLERYLAEGQSPDQPGLFVAWLHKRVPVYGYRFQGSWLDIGNKSELFQADRILRKKNGLSERSEYSPE
jgi:glucose-1-phosphate thymidylyltransferase